MPDAQLLKAPFRPVKRLVERIYWRFSQHPRLMARFQIPYLLNSRGLLGVGVEIGVCEGSYSEWLLLIWRGQKLISVDPWKNWSENYADVANCNQQTMDERYQRTCQLLKKFEGRSEIWRVTGAEAAIRLAAARLDFVYIDAQHHYEAVSEDLRLWFPKVRRGGLVAGHDYLDGNLPQGVFGVKRAVDEFVREQGFTLLTTREPGPSWYFFKR